MTGQFGAGLFVADKVPVVSRNNDDDTFMLWESPAGGTLTVSPVQDETITRGAKIIL